MQEQVALQVKAVMAVQAQEALVVTVRQIQARLVAVDLLLLDLQVNVPLAVLAVQEFLELDTQEVRWTKWHIGLK
jgi:hypothetical protein